MGFVSVRVPITLACGAYDRTAGLARGEIQPEGVDLTVLRERWDAAETREEYVI